MDAKVTFSLPIEDKELLFKTAEEQDLSVSQLLRKILKEYLNK